MLLGLLMAGLFFVLHFIFEFVLPKIEKNSQYFHQLFGGSNGTLANLFLENEVTTQLLDVWQMTYSVFSFIGCI